MALVYPIADGATTPLGRGDLRVDLGRESARGGGVQDAGRGQPGTRPFDGITRATHRACLDDRLDESGAASAARPLDGVAGGRVDRRRSPPSTRIPAIA